MSLQPKLPHVACPDDKTLLALFRGKEMFIMTESKATVDTKTKTVTIVCPKCGKEVKKELE